DRRLTQVLLNLVGNAIKFTDAGEVAVKAAASNGDYTIPVSDTGPGIAPADLGFRVEVPPGLPPARGDDRRLTQVLLNLVGNAIKFTDAGEVAVKAAASNGAYTISVRDTGPGIAEADQAKIFDEFQQADSTQTKAKGGTGLGLS